VHKWNCNYLKVISPVFATFLQACTPVFATFLKC
jgi:hypothetical protein